MTAVLTVKTSSRPKMINCSNVFSLSTSSDSSFIPVNANLNSCFYLYKGHYRNNRFKFVFKYDMLETVWQFRLQTRSNIVLAGSFISSCRDQGHRKMNSQFCCLYWIVSSIIVMNSPALGLEQWLFDWKVLCTFQKPAPASLICSRLFSSRI